MFYIMFNIFGFILMYFDKQFAIKNIRRVPEKVIFLISLLGAAVGVYIGMYAFRHKTKKPNFIIFIPLLAFLNIIFILAI